jgi:hypothetical protein
MTEGNLTVLLEEGKAYWLDSASLGLLPDNTIVRCWRNIPLQAKQEALAVLKARRLETNPKAETKQYDGVYRIQKVEDVIVRDKAGMVQYTELREHLALGLAQTLAEAAQFLRVGSETQCPGTATTWPASPAHTGTSAIQSDSRTITIRWVAIDPTKIEGVYAEQNLVEASALTVNGESKTGPWYLISRGDKQEDDGSATYEETWTLAETTFECVEAVGDMEIQANRYIHGVPKNRVKTVLEAEITALGSNYRYAGFTYRQKIYWRDNTADIIIEASDTPGKDVTRKSTTVASKQIDKHTYKHAHTLPDADTISGHTMGQGKKMVVDGDITGDGDFDYEHTVETAIKQEVALHTVKITPFSTFKEKKGDNLYDADIGAYAPTSPQTAGTTEKLDKAINDDGTFKAILAQEVAVSATSGIDESKLKRVDALETETKDTARNATNEPTLPSDTQTVGVVSTLKKVKNDFALWDKEETTETGHLQTASGSYDSASGTVYWWIIQNATEAEWNSAISTASLTSATNNSVRYNINRFKLRDGHIIKEPLSGGSGGTPPWVLGVISNKTFKGEREYKQGRSGVWKYRQITYTEVIEGHGGFAAAKTASSATGALVGTPIGNSRVEKVNSINWYSYLITSDEASVSWTEDYTL